WRPAQRTFVRPDCRRDPDARRPDTVPASAANDLYRYRVGTDCTGGDFATTVAGKTGRFLCATSLTPGPDVASCLRHAVAGTTLQQPRHAGAGNVAECDGVERGSTGIPLDVALARHGRVAGVFAVCLHDCDDCRGAEFHARRTGRRGSDHDSAADVERDDGRRSRGGHHPDSAGHLVVCRATWRAMPARRWAKKTSVTGAPEIPG